MVPNGPVLREADEGDWHLLSAALRKANVIKPQQCYKTEPQTHWRQRT